MEENKKNTCHKIACKIFNLSLLAIFSIWGSYYIIKELCLSMKLNFIFKDSIKDLEEEYKILLKDNKYYLIDIVIHYIICPTVLVLSFIFAIIYSFFGDLKIDKIKFIIWELLSIIIN